MVGFFSLEVLVRDEPGWFNILIEERVVHRATGAGHGILFRVILKKNNRMNTD